MSQREADILTRKDNPGEHTALVVVEYAEDGAVCHPAGGGFQGHIPYDILDEKYRPLQESDRRPHYRSYVGIDAISTVNADEMLIPAILDDKKWNGWEMPFFEREHAEAACALLSDGETMDLRLEWDDDAGDYVVKEWEYDFPEDGMDPTVSYPTTIDIDGESVKVWAVGDGVTWQEPLPVKGAYVRKGGEDTPDGAIWVKGSDFRTNHVDCEALETGEVVENVDAHDFFRYFTPAPAEYLRNEWKPVTVTHPDLGGDAVMQGWVSRRDERKLGKDAPAYVPGKEAEPFVDNSKEAKGVFTRQTLDRSKGSFVAFTDEFGASTDTAIAFRDGGGTEHPVAADCFQSPDGDGGFVGGIRLNRNQGFTITYNGPKREPDNTPGLD